MKKRFVYALIVFVSVFSSCEKDSIINNSKNVGISRIAYYPTITVMGDAIIAVPNGTAFTDPGAKASAGGTDVPVVATGTVDTGTDGVYNIIYTSENADGSSIAYRAVVVYTTADDAASHDLSGKYLRPATGVNAVWTKIAPGVYSVFNPGGSAGTNLTIVAINPSGFIISIPEQLGSDGSPTSSTDESYTNSSPATYSWRIVNPTYGGQLRTFIKQ